jgi:hypothetical protein
MICEVIESSSSGSVGGLNVVSISYAQFAAWRFRNGRGALRDPRSARFRTHPLARASRSLQNLDPFGCGGQHKPVPASLIWSVADARVP